MRLKRTFILLYFQFSFFYFPNTNFKRRTSNFKPRTLNVKLRGPYAMGPLHLPRYCHLPGPHDLLDPEGFDQLDESFGLSLIAGDEERIRGR